MSNLPTFQSLSPLQELWRDQKFRLAIIDAIGSTILLLATRFLSPTDVDLIKQLLVILQPVVIMVGVGLVVESRERIAAQARIHVATVTSQALAATATLDRVARSEEAEAVRDATPPPAATRIRKG